MKLFEMSMQIRTRILDGRSALLCKDNCKVEGLAPSFAESWTLVFIHKTFQIHSTFSYSLMASIKGTDKILLCFSFSRHNHLLTSFHWPHFLFDPLANIDTDINVLLFKSSLFTIVINIMSAIQGKWKIFIRVLYRKLNIISHSWWKMFLSINFHYHNELSPLTRSGVKWGLKITSDWS